MLMYVLMFNNTEVLKYNFEDTFIEVLDYKRVPWFCKKYLNNNGRLYLSFIEWLSYRLMPLTKTNAKQLYTYINCQQRASIAEKAKLVSTMRALSLNDSYWVRLDDEDIKFKDIDLRFNNFINLIDISLKGVYPKIIFNDVHPDFCTDGLFPKTWVRTLNGEILLYKSGLQFSELNVDCEVYSSMIIGCITDNNNSYVSYSKKFIDNIPISYCNLIDRENVSLISFSELYEFYGESFKKKVLSLFRNQIHNMNIVDYILYNTDRHTGNYYFMVDETDFEIVSLAPIFDFNQALIGLNFGTEDNDTLSQVYNNGQTIRQVFLESAQFADVKFDKDKISNLDIPNHILTSVLNRIEEYESIKGSDEAFAFLKDINKSHKI